MKDDVVLPRDPKKVGCVMIDVVAVEKEFSKLPRATPISSSVQFTTLSPLSLPLSLDTDVTSTTTKSQALLVAPRDTGIVAWQVLYGATLVQGVLFAFPLTFGVFQDFFGRDKQLSNSKYSVWIGVLSTGIPFMGAPLMTALCDTFPHIKWKHYVLLGWSICVASLVGASFSKSLMPLAITQGVLYAAGLLILDVPVLLILNTWFVKRRGLAYGILFGACDLFGFGAAIFAEYLLRRHGLKVALLTFAVMIFFVCGPALWLLRPRPAESRSLTPVQSDEELTLTPLTRRATPNLCPCVPTRYYGRSIFYIFALANLFQSLAYYLPFIYLPSYTTSLGYSSTKAAMVLAGANFAQIFGEVSFGKLSDKFNVHSLVLMSSLVASVAALTLWGLADSIVPLAFFAVIFGCFGSGLISLWARMGTLFGEKDAQMIYSVMSFGRGLGSIASGAISSALLAAPSPALRMPENHLSMYGNGKYASLILFVGGSTAISALMGLVGMGLGWRQNQLGRIRERRASSLPAV